MKRKFLLWFTLLVLTVFLMPSPMLRASPTYENFTTYEEVDNENDRIQKTANHIDHDAWRNEDTYVYKDFGVDYFGDFKHNVDAKSDLDWGFSFCWALTNGVDDMLGLRNANETYIAVEFYYWGGSKLIRLEEIYNDTSNRKEYPATPDKWYYLTIIKNGTSLKVEIYENAQRTSLLETLSITLNGNWKFQYVFACSTYNSGDSHHQINDIENLEFIVCRYVTFYRNSGGIFRANGITKTNGTTTEYNNGTVLELASLTQNSSYVFLNFTLWTYNTTEKLIDSYIDQRISSMWRYEREHPTSESNTESAGGQAIKMSETYKLYKIAFNMAREFGGNGTIRCYVYHMNETKTYGENATPIGEPIAISEPLDIIESFPTEGVAYYKNFTFTGNNQIILFKDRVYCFTGIFETRINGTWDINQQQNGEHSGNWYAWTGNDGGRWGYISGSYDQNFYLYGYDIIKQNLSATNPYNYTITQDCTIWCYFDKPSTFPLGFMLGGIIGFIIGCVIALAISKH